jgi:hypothetical protein
MSETDQVASDIIFRLRELPTPRDAALALAMVHAQLCIQGGGDDETTVRNMLKESDTAVLQAWSMFTGNELAS